MLMLKALSTVGTFVIIGCCAGLIGWSMRRVAKAMGKTKKEIVKAFKDEPEEDEDTDEE